MTEWKPKWDRVCESPETHGWGHTWLSFGHSHDYWCKFCPEFGVHTEDDRQMEFDHA